MKAEPFATKLPSDLTAQLDFVCKKLGLRKNFVLEILSAASKPVFGRSSKIVLVYR